MREGLLMVFILGVYAALEGFGIGLLLPVLQYLESGGQTLPTGSVWPYLTAASDAIGIPITLGTLLALAFAPIALRQGVYYLNTWYNARVQNRAIARLMVRAFKSIAHAELSFIERQDQGKLIGFVTGQVSRCGGALVHYIKLLGAVAVILVYTILLFALSWPLAVIAMVAMALVSAGVRRIMVGSRTHGKAVTEASVALTSAVRERLASLRLVKMHAREDAEAEYIGVLADSLRRASTRIAVAAARVEIIVDPALMLAVFLIIYIGVVEFGMTLASLGLFMFILLRLNGKAKEVNLGRQQLASLMPSFDYVESMLAEAESAPTPTDGVRPFEGLRESITFDDVHFAFSKGSTQVLDGVSLTIPSGSLTAIVGRSGAGKSTLVDMIPLLRRADSGKILFDGIPAEEFDLAALRRRIGFLTQEPILFNASIEWNLTYGIEGSVTPERIRAALDDSHCSEFVDALPKGLQTNLGDRGVRFSGGQRQRLALARVLLQAPDILILDEPTSALDSESESYIQASLGRLHGRTTLVVIAHRLSTVREADQIIVLEDGRVTASGRHSELLETSGVYKALFELQAYGVPASRPSAGS